MPVKVWQPEDNHAFHYTEMTTESHVVNLLRMNVQQLSALPEDFSALKAESKLLGFNFMEKMKLEWNSGKNRFRGEHEVLYGIFAEKSLLAVGGLNSDPYTHSLAVARIQHLYVLEAHRRRGLGETIVRKLLEHAAQHFTHVRLPTDTDAASLFYEKIGFKKVEDETATHIWDFKI